MAKGFANAQARAAELAQGENVEMCKIATLDGAAVVNFEENTWNQGDKFDIPTTVEDVEKCLITETFTNLPVNENTGEYPKGHCLIVEVTNDTLGYTQNKKFRLTAPSRQSAEYTYKESVKQYVSTGKMFGPNNTTAKEMRGMNNQGDMLRYLMAHPHVEVVSFAEGFAPIRKGQEVTGVRFQKWPVFEAVADAAPKSAKTK